MLCKHTVGFSEGVQAISQELVGLICRDVLFMSFYGALHYLEYCALNWKVCVCEWLFVDGWTQEVFSREESLFAEAEACSLVDMLLWPVWAGDSLSRMALYLGREKSERLVISSCAVQGFYEALILKDILQTLVFFSTLFHWVHILCRDLHLQQSHKWKNCIYGT